MNSISEAREVTSHTALDLLNKMFLCEKYPAIIVKFERSTTRRVCIFTGT